MSQSTENPTAARYAAGATPLAAVLDAVPADRWARPSPCEGWTARDVVRHLIETQRDFFTGRGLDLGPAPDLDADPAAAWRGHGPAVLGRTLVDFYVPDMVVHRWDVAVAVDGDTRLTDDELDRLESAIEAWGPAMYSDGVCQAALTPPDGASRQVRLLARMGRRGW
jgi:hypothetical protein